MIKVVQLNSCYANQAQEQREIMEGKYRLKMNPDIPYSKQVLNISSEPTAFIMYKNRHFK